MVAGMSTDEKFLAECARFLRRYRMHETRLGIEALNDPSFISRVRAGRSPRGATMDKVRAYMAEYRARASGKPRPKRAA